jgi:hypothetical protein
MTARTASVRVQSINSLFTMETMGLGVAPSELARFTVGMDTQKVDSVVTIWLMPSMMAFAMFPMASSARAESQSPAGFQVGLMPHSRG